MVDADQMLQRTAPAAAVARPLAPVFSTTLTEVAGCIMVGTACADMWFGIYTLTRAFIYIIAVALAFVGGGFTLRLTVLTSFFFLCGGLYILTALACPPVPNLVKSDIRNILVGFAFLATLSLPDLTRAAWERFQLRIHRTVLLVSTLGAILGLAKLFYYNNGGIVLRLMDSERGYPLGSSLQMDYNFYSLPLLLGLLSAFWLMKRDKSSRWCTLALLCVPELVLAVLLSGSRRGLITLIWAVPILSAWLIFYRRDNQYGQRGAGVSWKGVIAGLLLVAVLCMLNLDSLTRFVSEMASTDSFSKVSGRWRTFEEGTYADSRMHYWTITLERLARFEPVEYIFGQGFAYVTDLGADPSIPEDYPHNFVLSSMLYGGVAQTGCLIGMVSVALLRLSRRRQGSGMFAAWFALVIFFLLTSANSFFSSEIAIFLTVFGLSITRFGPKQVGMPTTRTRAMHLVRQAA
jgi:hypothetical protein